MTNGQKKTLAVMRRFRKLIGDIETLRSRARILASKARETHDMVLRDSEAHRMDPDGPARAWGIVSCLNSMTRSRGVLRVLEENLEIAMKSPAFELAVEANKRFVETLPRRK